MVSRSGWSAKTLEVSSFWARTHALTSGDDLGSASSQRYGSGTTTPWYVSAWTPRVVAGRDVARPDAPPSSAARRQDHEAQKTRRRKATLRMIVTSRPDVGSALTSMGIFAARQSSDATASSSSGVLGDSGRC